SAAHLHHAGPPSRWSARDAPDGPRLRQAAQQSEPPQPRASQWQEADVAGSPRWMAPSWIDLSWIDLSYRAPVECPPTSSSDRRASVAGLGLNCNANSALKNSKSKHFSMG